MNSEWVELGIPTDLYRSYKDEQSFFQWLESIKGFVSAKGLNITLYVTFDPSQIGRPEMEEIVAIFARYDICNPRQLRFLGQCREGDWFKSPDRYWHDAIY